MPATGIQQGLGAHDIRHHEVLRARDGSVHVCLRREVDHDIVSRDHLVQHRAIADIALDEGVARIPRDGSQVRPVARVGEFVEHEHTLDIRAQAAIEQAAHVVRADEARASCHHVAHWRILRMREPPTGRFG